MTGKNLSVVFVSDLHFGANYQNAYPNREAHFCRFLQSLRGQVSHLFILGDLFEFWMEYKHYIPKRHFQVLVTLNELVHSGVEVHYLSGNHDFNLGTFFRKSLGVHIHVNPFKTRLQGREILLLHGDGMAASDVSYRLVKKVLRAKWANYLFKLIHPDWGMNLAEFVGKTSRDIPRQGKSKEYTTAAGSLLQEAEVVMHGHTHQFFIRPEGNGLYINTGEWLKKLQYIKLQGGEFSTQEYVPSDNNPGPS